MRGLEEISIYERRGREASTAVSKRREVLLRMSFDTPANYPSTTSKFFSDDG